MGWGTWLLAMVTPLVGRIITALGFSVVTVTGMTIAVQAVRDQFISSINSMPGDILNVFLYAGGGVAFGMIMGAITTRIAIWSIMNTTKILGVNPG